MLPQFLFEHKNTVFLSDMASPVTTTHLFEKNSAPENTSSLFSDSIIEEVNVMQLGPDQLRNVHDIVVIT